MAKPKITLFYDIVSPFAYMAYYMARHSPVFQQCEITFVPIFLGGLMKACDNRAPLEIKNKANWINIERKRWSKLYDIPICETMPDGFPVSTLSIMRALTALNQLAPKKLIEASDAFYYEFWVNRNEGKVDKPDGINKVLSKVVGEDMSEQVLKKMGSDENKKTLNQRTQDAFDEGGFGLPYWVATRSSGEKAAFWGFDHIGQLLHFLGLERPAPKGGWQAMM